MKTVQSETTNVSLQVTEKGIMIVKSTLNPKPQPVKKTQYTHPRFPSKSSQRLYFAASESGNCSQPRYFRYAQDCGVRISFNVLSCLNYAYTSNLSLVPE